MGGVQRNPESHRTTRGLQMDTSEGKMGRKRTYGENKLKVADIVGLGVENFSESGVAPILQFFATHPAQTLAPHAPVFHVRSTLGEPTYTKRARRGGKQGKEGQ